MTPEHAKQIAAARAAVDAQAAAFEKQDAVPVLTPAQAEAKAAAMRNAKGGIPDTIEVVQNGKKISMTRCIACATLGKGLATLP